MKKIKTLFVCSNCGYESLKWLGKCPQCDNWDTLTEQVAEVNKNQVSARVAGMRQKPQRIGEITSYEEERFLTNISEFDRTLGGGFVQGSVVLIGGEPGIGKSTLILQAATKINRKVLYVTGEESLKQIKMRATRLKVDSNKLLILAETDLKFIFDAISEEKPDVVIIDSIQTIRHPDLENSAGTVTQIRDCTAAITDEAKKKNFVAVIIGHVTKDGTIAGPKILEHIVDTVIQFEGENNLSYRIVRALKNRYGNANEIGIFEMTGEGLREVTNPSELFLGERSKAVSGTAVTAAFEGTRAVLVEVQALVTPVSFAAPARISNGFDSRRLSILLAVIERRAGFKLSGANVFLNIAGGLKIDEPAVDLTVCISVISAFNDKPIDNYVCVVGEVGLGGEIRSVTNIEKRIIEAGKLGFREIVIPYGNYKQIKEIKSFADIKITSVKTLYEAVKHLIKE